MTAATGLACRRCRGPVDVVKHRGRGLVVIACRNTEGCGERSLPMKRRRLERLAPRRPRRAPATTWAQDQHWRDRDEREDRFWNEGAA